MKPTQKSWEWGFGLVLAKEATIGLRLSFTEVWYEAHLHFPFYCPRPLKQHETNLIGSQGGNQLGTIVYLKIVYWTCLISIECSLNCAAVATQRLFCIELLFATWRGGLVESTDCASTDSENREVSMSPKRNKGKSQSKILLIIYILTKHILKHRILQQLLEK